MKYITAILILISIWLSPYLMFKLMTKHYADTKPEFTHQLLGEFTVTSYRSVKAATDNSPYWSSIGVHTNPWMVAVSRDFLSSGQLRYHDTIYIEEIGFKVVGDCMNARFRERFDVWVQALKEEQEFHRKFKNKPLKVWLVKRG